MIYVSHFHSVFADGCLLPPKPPPWPWRRGTNIAWRLGRTMALLVPCGGGNSMEIHGKSHRKSRKSHGNPWKKSEKSWKSMGKSRKSHGNPWEKVFREIRLEIEKSQTRLQPWRNFGKVMGEFGRIYRGLEVWKISSNEMDKLCLMLINIIRYRYNVEWYHCEYLSTGL